jgi:hypothetical protein
MKAQTFSGIDPRKETVMNIWTDNSFELLKVFFAEEFLALPTAEFTKVMFGFREGKYELIVIDEIA